MCTLPVAKMSKKATKNMQGTPLLAKCKKRQKKTNKLCMCSPPVAPVWLPIINKQCLGFKVLQKTNKNKQNMYGLTTCCTSLTPRATPCQLPPCSLSGRLEICLLFFKDLRFVCLFSKIWDLFAFFSTIPPNFLYQNEKKNNLQPKISSFGANNVG